MTYGELRERFDDKRRIFRLQVEIAVLYGILTICGLVFLSGLLKWCALLPAIFLVTSILRAVARSEDGRYSELDLSDARHVWRRRFDDPEFFSKRIEARSKDLGPPMARVVRELWKECPTTQPVPILRALSSDMREFIFTEGISKGLFLSTEPRGNYPCHQIELTEQAFKLAGSDHLSDYFDPNRPD